MVLEISNKGNGVALSTRFLELKLKSSVRESHLSPLCPTGGSVPGVSFYLNSLLVSSLHSERYSPVFLP